MKVLLTLWISAALLQEVVPNSLVRVPRHAISGQSTVHTEYEAKYEQKGKNGNESSSVVKGNQEIHHHNCENWNDFAEKCASLIKDLIASLANAVSSRPGDATNMHLNIKNSFKHFDNTHNCSCLNHTANALSALDFSSLFNNVTMRTIGAGNDQTQTNIKLPCDKTLDESQSEKSHSPGMMHVTFSPREQELIMNAASDTIEKPSDNQPIRALTNQDETGMNPEEAESSTGCSTNNNRRETGFQSPESKDGEASMNTFRPNLGHFSGDQPIISGSDQESNPPLMPHGSFSDAGQNPQVVSGPDFIPDSVVPKDTPIKFPVSSNPPFKINEPPRTIPLEPDYMHEPHHEEKQPLMNDPAFNYDVPNPGLIPSSLPIQDHPVTPPISRIPENEAPNSNIIEGFPKPFAPNGGVLSNSDSQFPPSESHTSMNEPCSPPTSSTVPQPFFPPGLNLPPNAESPADSNPENQFKPHPFLTPPPLYAQPISQLPPTASSQLINMNSENNKGAPFGESEMERATHVPNSLVNSEWQGFTEKPPIADDPKALFYPTSKGPNDASDSSVVTQKPMGKIIDPGILPSDPIEHLKNVQREIKEYGFVDHPLGYKPIAAPSEEYLSKPTYSTTDAPANLINGDYPAPYPLVPPTEYPKQTVDSASPVPPTGGISVPFPAPVDLDSKPEVPVTGEGIPENFQGSLNAPQIPGIIANGFTSKPEIPLDTATLPNGDSSNPETSSNCDDNEQSANVTPAPPESAYHQSSFVPTAAPKVEDAKKDIYDTQFKTSQQSEGQEIITPLPNGQFFPNPGSMNEQGLHSPMHEEHGGQNNFQPLEPVQPKEPFTLLPNTSNEPPKSSDQIAPQYSNLDSLSDKVNTGTTTPFGSEQPNPRVPFFPQQPTILHPFPQSSTAIPNTWLEQQTVTPNLPRDGFNPNPINTYQDEMIEKQTLSPQKPTTFQTTSMKPTPAHTSIGLIPSDILGPMSRTPPSLTTPHSTEIFPVRPTSLLPHHHHDPKEPLHEEDDDDDEDCCSCESCTEEDKKMTSCFRSSACRDLEDARRELKAIFDKIKKKLKCGRKV